MDTKTRIFKLLDKLGMEQKAFAEAVGVKESTVSDWRRGKSNSYNRFLVKIAQVLGTTTADLLGEAQKSSPPSEEDRLMVAVMKGAEIKRQIMSGSVCVDEGAIRRARGEK